MKKKYQQPLCRCTVVGSLLPLVASGESYNVNSFKSGGEEELGGDAAPSSSPTKANPIDWKE